MKYKNLTVIIIDEISMVGNGMLSLIESRFFKNERKQADTWKCKCNSYWRLITAGTNR
jgi:hypothetical protein